MRRILPRFFILQKGAHYKQEQYVSLFFSDRKITCRPFFFTVCQSRLFRKYVLFRIQKKSWENDILKLKTINIFLFYSSLKKIIVLSRRNTLKTIKNIYD
jgi:hypothetical protein